MKMDIHHKSRIHWACRRGMLELDIALMPFFKYEYERLSNEDKKNFISLLSCDDPDLFNWLMGYGTPQDPNLAHIVKIIQERNRLRDSLAL